MRNRYECLLAGTMLALIVAAPLPAAADPRVQSVGPLPPSLNGQRPVRRHEIVLPPPSQDDAAPARQDADDQTPPPRAQSQRPQQQRVQDQRVQDQRAPEQRVQEQRAQEQRPQRAPEQRAQEQAPAPAPRDADSGFDIKGTLDKMLGASDGQITDKLRGGVKQAHIERATDRQAIESLYAGRNYAPLWIHDGRLTGRAKDAIARLKSAADEGLDASDYPTPDFGGGADALAQADVKLTNSVLDFARNMETGRIAPTRVAVEIDYGTKAPDASDILRKIASASDINATLNSFDPPHEGFRALKRKLAELRNASVGEPNDRIADGQPIKPGAKDPRVPQLRGRLKTNLPGDSRTVVREHGRQVVKLVKADELVYDKALYLAVRNVQANADIKPTGVIDSKTIAAINGPKPGQQVDTVLANMERWRWLPRDLGSTYVMVNVPDYTLKVVSDHHPVWRTKIVAGKPQTPTPLTSATMDTVIVNPSWYVPQSIIQNELLPQYASDPKIFDRLGLEVKKGPDGNINVVQPPGAANALGRIKFNFPNKFQVYLHDTPEKNLFKYDRRAFSHGCMRVEDPTMFGQVMLHLAMAGPTPELAADLRAVRQGREDLQAAASAAGASDLPDRVRRRRGQAANSRRPLRHGCAHSRHPARRRAQDRRRAAAAGPQARRRHGQEQSGNPAPGRTPRSPESPAFLRAALPLGGRQRSRVPRWPGAFAPAIGVFGPGNPARAPPPAIFGHVLRVPRRRTGGIPR